MITSALEFLRGQEVNKNNFLLFGDEPKLIFYIKKKIKSLHANYEKVVISIEEKILMSSFKLQCFKQPFQ